ncbi:molybdopterin-synthase adenylyltransferase MoeB [Myxococcota bacterium]|nr:molybdopterin-synthase adenylyltransferase MoeB [Myxococcota bacterium]
MTKDELVALARASIPQLETSELARAIEGREDILILDVREPDEVATGKLPGARHVPRGFLELRIESLASSRDQRVVLYCASGVRSALAARALVELGYRRVASLAGGFNAWKSAGRAWVVEPTLSAEQKVRYSRHVMLSEVGEAGQLALLGAKVLLVGAGGLGSPAALYLAAAGIGTLGVVDPDVVDVSNLQRQIMHRTGDVNVPKVESATRAIRDLNPDVRVVAYRELLTADNVMRILDDGWQVVVDGCDNFATRYLINDACVLRGVPNVHGSIFQFEGQATVFAPSLGGPCYRCLYPEPPPPGMVPSCGEAGVLGVLPGLVGTLQALETIKLVLGAGTSLVGRLARVDALELRWRELRIRRDPACPLCGEAANIRELQDYAALCGLAQA